VRSIWSEPPEFKRARRRDFFKVGNPWLEKWGVPALPCLPLDPSSSKISPAPLGAELCKKMLQFIAVFVTFIYIRI
jgi:hypothetical protein